MPVRPRNLLELMGREALTIAKDASAWTEFFSFASRFYKYSFTDCLLIHAQRPDATQCASLEIWNSKVKRRVKKGARCIYLLDDSGNNLSVRYVFDVSDTFSHWYPPPQPWRMKPEYQSQVLEELKDAFGDIETCGEFGSDLITLVGNVVEDNHQDYLREVLRTGDDSFLEELDEQNVSVRFRELLKAGVSWCILNRTGLNPDEYRIAEGFRHLYEFNTISVIAQLGSAIQDLSGLVLRQMERTVRHLDRLAQSEKIVDNRTGIQHEREDNHGRDHLHEERGLPDTRLDAAPGTGGRHRTLGTTAQAVSEGVPERDLREYVDNGRPQAAPAGRGPAGPGTARDHNEPTPEAIPATRARDSGLGTAYEQPKTPGRGDDPQRTDLQLTLFPTEEEQRNIITAIEAGEQKPSAFSLPQEDIDHVLLHGSGFQNGKTRIVDFFESTDSSKERADFLKKEYGIGGRTELFPDGTQGSSKHDAKGITIEKNNVQVVLSWSKVQKRIGELIASGKYLPEQQSEPEDTKAIAGEDDVIPSSDESTDTLIEAEKRGDHPAPPEPINYRITDDRLGEGGTKTKYHRNIEAIRLLKRIESENRMATAMEQETLAQYVGWGGLPQAFDESNTQWQEEYSELKSLLTEDEYATARASTLNAHYTSPVVIKAIYQVLDNLGFSTGNILEPACGIGNFFGLIPDSMNDSRLYGVELDSITGRIAKQLYQKAHITVQRFESTDLPDSFFDAAVGNVPFGAYKLNDKRYDRYNFLIHDYFFAKTLDKVRPGGIIAFITSKGTLDKQNPEIRRYIAQRAELLGAVRLPNTAFKANAGTEVTTDILFLQKRDRIIDIEPDWVHLGQTSDGIPVNSYYVENPHMLLGNMAHDDSMYGDRQETTCQPVPGVDLSEQLHATVSYITGRITEYEIDDEQELNDTLPADPSVRNFSFTIVEDTIYFRENSRLIRQDMNKTAEGRVKGMIGLRDYVRHLMDLQLQDAPDEDITTAQRKLHELYDSFTAEYGLINSRANANAFDADDGYYLLCSLEVLDEDRKNLEHKAEIFYTRTIRKNASVTSVDTASEALTVSLTEKARVDIPYMSQLSGISPEEIISELRGIIFRDLGHYWNPELDKQFEYRDISHIRKVFDAEAGRMKDALSERPYDHWVTADEYLSGNVREKLRIAQRFHEITDLYPGNADALHSIQPKDLEAGEIDVRLGATWVPPDVIKSFVFELLETPRYMQWNIKVHYSPHTSEWNIEGKNNDRFNINANEVYGTSRITAYKIMEETLNLRDVRIMDTVRDADGTEHRVLNRTETTLAQQKQAQIREAFKEWIFRNADRREQLVRLYNDTFNCNRSREYDGGHLRFPGMNPEVGLKEHQLNAVARILYGGNTLLAHVVGSGKTFEMIAAGMELKRLGLAQKNLYVVPNHLTEQWASEFLRLYPSANILVATRKDFQTANRKKFCSRISTGDYDAVIIGHSQFERIPLSQDRQKRMLQDQIDEIVDGIEELKSHRGERFTIKQMEKARKSLESRLQKLADSPRDDVVTFEELGVDRLFVDEAHYYRNAFLYTKMRNVAGISQTEARKSSDLMMKCRFMDELTGRKGIIFATGTPVSNSMTELYVMQRYLQHDELSQRNLQHFDSWASTFGETQTAIELAPEGTGYRTKTRFSRFYNLPELMAFFREATDIQTADMLQLPVPKLKGDKVQNIAIQPTDLQKQMVQALSDRADKVRNRQVQPHEDNMLSITSDGRMLALDQRLMNPSLPDDPRRQDKHLCQEYPPHLGERHE